MSANEDSKGPALIAGSIPSLVKKIGITEPAKVDDTIPKKIDRAKIMLTDPIFATSPARKKRITLIMIAEAKPFNTPMIASLRIALKVLA